MTAKIVQSFKTADPSAYVFLYRNSEWQEWSACYHKKSDPRHKPETVYFASDKQDALDQVAFLVDQVASYASLSAAEKLNKSW